MAEDTNLENMSVGEAVATLVYGLPKSVRDFVTGPEREAVTLQLTQKYNLHVDQAGTFERAFAFMLLGLYTPAQFVVELRDEGVNEETIQGLAKDLNERVFLKLREQERVEASVRTRPVPPPPPVYVPPAPAAYVSPAPMPTPYQEPPFPSVLPTPIEQPRPAAVSAPSPAPVFVPPQPTVTQPPISPPIVPTQSPLVEPAKKAPVYDFPSQGTSPLLEYDPSIVPAHLQPARTMARDIAAFQSGGQEKVETEALGPVTPSYNPRYDMPPATQPAPAPAPAAQNQSLPRQTPPVEPAPQVLTTAKVSVAPTTAYIPPQTTRPPAPQPAARTPQATPAANANRDALHAVLKEYGIDPYREPPE